MAEHTIRKKFRTNIVNAGCPESYAEYFYGGGVTVIEWADKIRPILPIKHIEVRLKVAGESKRKIVIKNVK